MGKEDLDAKLKAMLYGFNKPRLDTKKLKQNLVMRGLGGSGFPQTFHWLTVL